MGRHKKQIPKGAEQGTRYGGLVVLRVVEAAGQNSIIEFKCDCGCALTRRLVVAKKAGKLGRKAVCRECESKEKSESVHNRFKIENYIDRRFGRLVVTGYNYDPERKRPKTRLVCV